MKKKLIYLFIGLLLSACSLKQELSYTDEKIMPSIKDTKQEKAIIPKAFNKIAIMVPEKTIKSYASIIINASLAYILRQESDLELKIYSIGEENEKSIQESLKKLKEEEFHFVIAGFTQEGVEILSKLSLADDFSFIFPLVHKNNTTAWQKNFIFSAIDYEAQIIKLLEKSNANIAVFHDESMISERLNEKLSLQENELNLQFYKINDSQVNFEKIFYPKKTQYPSPLNNFSFFVNLNSVKTALFISQIRANEVQPFLILSTQINYNPALLSLSQSQDRQRLLIANSIFNQDSSLSYLNENFAQDINYNWVAYATSVGLDYLYVTFINKKATRLFSEPFNEGQMLYNVELVRASGYNFKALE